MKLWPQDHMLWEQHSFLMAVSLMQTNLRNHSSMGLSEKDIVNKLAFSSELRKKVLN